MADQDSKMVLRTVYLTPDLDEQLRVRAFRSKTTKNDLIREAVARWIAGEDAAQAPAPSKSKKALSRSRSRTSAAPRLKTATGS